MYVRNVHERDYDAPVEELGALLETLGTPDDRVWPADRWPRMRFDAPVAVGAQGGHGPIRYVVETIEPAREVRFRFTAPRGFDGTHAFVVDRLGSGSRLTHLLVMDTSGLATLSWAVVYRPLHDALVEDAFDRIAAVLGEAPAGAPWSRWVTFLRSLLARRRTRSLNAGSKPT